MRRWVVGCTLLLLLVLVIGFLLIPTPPPPPPDPASHAPARPEPNVAPLASAVPSATTTLPATTTPTVVSPAAGPRCAVRGLVYQPDGTPAEGAAIRYSWKAGLIQSPVGPDAVAEMTAMVDPILTDEAGAFSLSDLLPGSVTLVAEHETGRVADRLELYAYEPFTEVVLVLESGDTLAGRVVDGAGTGIPGAQVMPLAMNGRAMNAWQGEALSATTGPDGDFRLYALSIGEWTLHAAADGYGDAISPPIPSGVDNARIVLGAPVSLLCDVVDAMTERAVPGVGLVLKHRERGTPPREATSDETGAARFTDLGPGDYTLDVRDPEYALQGERLEIVIESTRTPDRVTVAVGLGGRIVGRVSDATTDRGIAGLVVLASSPARGQFTSLPTDAEGHYTIVGLPSADYSVRPPRTVPGYPQNATAELRKKISVAAGIDTGDVDFVLTAGAMLAGVVIDAEAAPVSGATVRARNTVGSQNLATYKTAEDGRFVFWDYGPGEEVNLSAETLSAKSSLSGPHVAGAPGSDAIELLLDITCDGVLAGRVLDTRGKPVSCSIQAHPREVALQFPVVPPIGHTDGHGYFVLTGVCPGIYTLVMVPRSQVRQEHGPVRLNVGQALTGLTLVYDQGELRDITGIVIDTAGNPVPRARVKVGATDGVNDFPGMSTLADEQGNFVLADLPEGVYTLSAEHESFVEVESVIVEAGATDVQLEMFAAPVLSGQVTDTAGNPINTFTLTLLPTGNPQAPPFRRTFTDGAGTFVMVAPRREAWTLHVEAAGFAPVSLDLGTLRFEETLDDLVLALEPVRD